jgi:hypothetical protein
LTLCGCAADVAYCRKLANELGFLQLCPTTVHEDNLGAKQIAEPGHFKGRSKHFELRWRFLHHYINRGIASIKAIKHMEEEGSGNEVNVSGRARRQRGWWKRGDIEIKLNTVNMTAWVHKECDIMDDDDLLRLKRHGTTRNRRTNVQCV